jgi:hypothetical protein
MKLRTPDSWPIQQQALLTIVAFIGVVLALVLWPR